MGLVDISLTSAMRTTLFSLQNTSAKVERTQERLATGKRVNTALDNPTNFFAAQAHLNRAADLSTRKDGMNEAIQTGDAAHTGLKALASMIDTAKGIANSAHSANPSDRTSLAGQFNQILGQIDSIAADSSYRGTNLLNDDVLTVNFNEKGSSNLTIQGMNATSLGLEVQRVGFNSEVPIAAGSTTGYAITPEGQVGSFGGSNVYGENDIPVAAESGVTSVSAGSGFALALKSDGMVVGWGNNTSGQSSVPLSAQSGVTAIAAGSLHSLALKDDGSVIAWGSNTSGQTSVPVAAQSGVTAIAAGGLHSLALKDDGSVIAWGSNTSGQTSVPAAAQSGVIAIAAGNSFSLALKDDGSVIAWGTSVSGFLPQSGVTAIAAGAEHALALNSDGSVALLCTDFSSGIENIPTNVQSGVNTIAVGGDVALALKNDGTIVGWGDFFGVYSGDIQGTGFSSTNSWSTDAGISKSEQQLETAMNTLRTNAATMSSTLSVIGVRKEFTDTMVANLETGADNLTLADMNEEGANMLMLQTRQNLGITSLSMAGQSAQAVMKLF